MAQKIDISQFGHIISHFDGNNNDKDDIAAIPIAATLTKVAGLQNKSTFFYNNNLGEPNEQLLVKAMRKSAAFAEKLGIDTFDYQANTQQATNELVKILNSGQKILAIEGGPMEAIYRALEKTKPQNRKNITLLSHSSWNENRNLATRKDIDDVRTWAELKRDFPEVKFIDIKDQNGQGDSGFNSRRWNWLDNTSNPVLKEARSLMKNAQEKVNDPSDAGMHFFAITGNENADPSDAQRFFQTNQPSFNSNPRSNQTLNPSLDESIIVEAENMQLGGEYKIENVGVASGNKVISLIGGAKEGTGTAKFNFNGTSGKYDIKITYFDENDGVGRFNLNQGNQRIASVNLNQQLGSHLADSKTLTSTKLNGISVKTGDTFTLTGLEDKTKTGTEHIRVDKIEFILAESITSDTTPESTPQPQPDPTPENLMMIEAESMQLGGEYKTENIDAASGNQVISLIGGAKEGTGTAKFNFNGISGKYDLKVTYFDENDGVGRFNLKQGNQQIASVNLNQQLGSNLADSKTLTSTTIQGISVATGEQFTLTGFEDKTSKGTEHIRIDKVEFMPVTSEVIGTSEVIRINAGGSAFTDTKGNQWSGDKYFQGGKTYSTTAGIDRTQDDSLFQSERWGKNIDYDIPVANGNYQVNLNFAEIYWNQDNQRVFDVKLENQLVLDNFDIHQGVGGKNIAVEKSFNVNVQDGVLNLDMNASIDNAKLSSIEILPN